MIKIICTFVPCLIFASCLSFDNTWCKPLSPSELNTHSERYKDQAVTVRGYVILNPDGHVLYESQTLHDDFSRGVDTGGNFDANKYEKYCLTIGNPDLLYRNRSKFAKKTIVIRGKFVTDYLDAQHIDLGACPLPTAVIIDEGYLKQRYHLP